MRMRYFIVFAALVLMGCVSCKRSEKPAEPRQEDLQAKKMLQGIWISADDDSPVLMAKGDSIFYPDSTSVPVAYKIISDTLFLSGATETSYAIERQTEHLFQFRNQTGDLVKLVKSEDASDFSYFDSKPPVVLNQCRLRWKRSRHWLQKLLPRHSLQLLQRNLPPARRLQRKLP